MLFQEDSTILYDPRSVEGNWLSLTLKKLSFLLICRTIQVAFNLRDNLFHDQLMSGHILQDLSEHVVALEHDFAAD